MNEQIIKDIKDELNIKEEQITTVLKLLEEGNTIPFIARYRKEATSNLDEEQIRKIEESYKYQVSLNDRKEAIIRLIDEKGLLTDELTKKIKEATKLVEIEDIYRPFKEKKKTKATDAINNGLEPLAKQIMAGIKIEDIIDKYLNDKIKTKEEAIEGAMYIIAEWISDNAYYRKWIRNYIYNNGFISSKLKPKAVDENKTYQMYYEFNEQIKYIKSYRVLALNRGENEKILNVSIDIDKDKILDFLNEKIIKENNINSLIIKEAITDSYKRLIFPSIEREIRSELSTIAEDNAIDVFSKNLEQLLLTPPMKEKNVLGIDPAFRTGCKMSVVDSTGKVLNIDVIYPHDPQNKIDEAKVKIKDIIKKYNIDIIAIGNGTASRETEKLVADTIKELENKIPFVIVSEAGASVYSASKLAIEEFPDLTVEKRSAVSIARRLQDPLSELVKIDPKSIGVGQYQHDVAQNKLSDSLTFVVEKCVNGVGVNVNTASTSLLSYISGLSKKIVNNIIETRNKIGKFNSREELKKISGMGDKSYEQAIGFLRILEGNNKLDETSIHPESYNNTIALLNHLGLTISDIGTNNLKDKIKNINKEDIIKELHIDKYTLEDIIESLLKPNRDLRDNYNAPLLKSDILTIDDLSIGMKLQGTIRNIVDFGVFIDIGLKNDGLAHISKLTNKFIKHPMEVVSVGDIVDCYIEKIDKDTKKVSLSLIELK